ncbi:uncharacterized protein LOC123548623 [Mercenaria mercenaria]|uniref:uncharacterized protein LOC123548623 n=1 Tax=Mercenaria mercenaria TaxID=6596 RepID=UPI00234F9828|nr:uncharacterized protein LOC123548623 [Mercenaria mercenaria]
MCYVLIFVFAIITVIHSAPKLATKTTFWDIPTGHCDPVCSCQMDGLYYSEGEQWAKPEDPCTIYKCFKNGFYEPVQKGCWYKEQCHMVNSTWSEGCHTFSCTENADFVYYKLKEAGCSLATGGCLPVGARWDDGCDVLECQLDGECLKTKKVRTGCAVQGTCKRIDSYWHDGCTVYMCANESNSAVTRSLANELMQWPDGNYAILKPQSGCPSDVPQVWSEGSRKHYSAGRNIFSKPLTLAGNYTEEFMRHDFCIHGTTSNSAMLPRYKTYWEQGSYCILRRNGICPRGFSDGYISFDDNKAKSKSVSTGVLPDGDFMTKTGLYFCCRKDGSVLNEIVLPKDENFVLFMQNGETECQTVRGMSHSVEFVTFDGTAKSKHEKRGLTPSAKIIDGDLTLNFCHYKTMECGCSDPSGEFVAVNTEKEINCVIKKCISEMGMKIFKIVSGGCLVNGKCQPEGSRWSVNHGETCRSQTCERVFAGPVTMFEVKDGFPGCRDGAVCKNVGEEIYRGCYTSRCTSDPVTNTTAFKVIKADCPWLDSCKAPNTTWEYNCMTYRCDMNVNGGHYQWNVLPIKYGCNDGNGNCYEVGTNVSGQCFDAVCRLSENKTVVYLDVTKGGCAWKDTCKTVNATWKDGCHDFKCEWIDTKTGFTAIVNATDVSCEWNNTCYKQDDVWSDRCIDYKCIVTREADAVNWSVQTVRLACSFKGKCLAVGKEITKNCVTYKCNLKGDQLRLDPNKQ